MKQEYKAIIFDFGGVIINIDFALTHSAFQELGVNNFTIGFSQAQQTELFDKFEKDEIEAVTFRREIRKYLKPNTSDADIDLAWNKMLLDIPKQRIEWLLELKKKYTCVLLSNTNTIHYDFFRADLETVYGYKRFSDLFDKTYFSHEIGMRKPDKEIYEYVLSDLNLKPSEILFLDDTQKNITKAKELGWNCILWQDKELDELLNL